MKIKPVTIIFLLFAFFWTVVLITALITDKNQVYDANKELAKSTSRTLLQQIVLTRTWNALHGGVYVPLTEKTAENQYLEVPDKTVTTTDGKTLTMLNPAYMTRQLFELSEDKRGMIGKITSLNPINPKNAPDKWEKNALRSVKSADTEVSEIVEKDNKKVLRFFIPLETDESCLRCHAKHGYKVGDIRGGLSLQLPYTPYQKSASYTFGLFALTVLILGAIGYGGLYGGWFYIRSLTNKLAGTNAQLQQSLDKNILLQREANHRIKNNLSLINSIINLQKLKNQNEMQATSKDKAAMEQFMRQLEDIESRISAVASLHDILHRTSKTDQNVDLSGFLTKIASNTIEKIAPHPLQSNINIIPYTVPPDKAVTIGMVLTELLLNALKHGQNNNENAEIDVALFSAEENIQLRVKNTIDPEWHEKNAPAFEESFGSQLIHSLIHNVKGDVNYNVEGSFLEVVCTIPMKNLNTT